MFATRYVNSYRLAEELDWNSSFNPMHARKRVPAWQFTEEEEYDWGKHDSKRRRKLDSISNNTQINYSSVHVQPAACNSNTGGFELPRTNPSFQPPVSVLLNSLLSQGLLSLNNNQKVNSVSGPSAVGVSQGVKSQNNQQVHGSGSASAIGVEFGSANLKLRRESVISALYSDLPRQCATCGVRFVSGEEHSNHMDWHVRKNRSSRNRKTKPSPMWFVSTDMWLRAAVAAGEAQHRVTDCVASVGVKEVDLPADDEQPACALCRERFEDYYCHEMESWMYKGAMYMYAPDDGSAEGIDDKSKLGPIVHAKCRPRSNRTRRKAS